ncbi:hypothetical protein PBI_GAIA_145 [Mycobacterium phage Gaia]|uniref:Uncharacterized protein n=1 Tax=Mycobacterium phage Gaia TaxID=1486472 RepID=A0A068F2K8_9CAUD|nr:hypothetical protein VC46_gp088 [Mycobacterium phage Gaia]AID58964.1 hypothetical protein PBI_GAIA_145 [Mycobacterium phage Gaia]
MISDTHQDRGDTRLPGSLIVELQALAYRMERGRAAPRDLTYLLAKYGCLDNTNLGTF